MKNSIRKTRSDKFPLTLHPSGQYCKKIKGHIYYFGSDRKQALENFLNQAIFLHGYNSALQKTTLTILSIKSRANNIFCVIKIDIYIYNCHD